MPRALWRRRQGTRTDGQCKQRGENAKKEPKRKARDQKRFSEMKNVFDELICKLNEFYSQIETGERISVLKRISTETSRTEKQREQRLKKKQTNRTSKDCETTTRYVTCIMRMPEKEKRERNRRHI